MIRVNCNLCGRDEWRVRYPATMANGQQVDVDAFRCTHPGYGNHAQIVECVHCGHVYANPRWTDAEIIAAYTAVEDETYVEERTGRELTFRKHLEAMERHVGPANGRLLLDVGACIGVFVEVAANAGWQAWGIEPSAWAAQQAQQQGLNVVQGTLEAPDLASRHFDVITMWDVIEHFTDPSVEISRAYQLLRPGGWLVVHTMDIDSMAAKVMGARWPWLMDMHLHYFSQRTLAELLRQHHFQVAWLGVQGRYLRLGYLATRVTGLAAPVGRMVEWLVARLGVAETAVPVNFGDLFTIYARRPT